MSKIIISAAIFMLIAFCSKAQEGVSFEELDWIEALEKANEENKLVFLEAYVNWSQPCTMLEKFALQDEGVGAFYNENFINIRMDMEAFPGVELAEIYEIYAFPYLLFVRPDGEVVHRGCGVLDAKEMIALGKEAMGGQNLAYYQEKFDSGDRSAEFLAEYSMLLENACMDKTRLIEEYFRTVKYEDWTNEASWTMINLNVTDPYSDQFQYLMKNQSEFAGKYGKDTVDKKIYNVLLDQFIAIYEGADITLFATQALRDMLSKIDFNQKNELKSLVDMKYADLKQNWDLYAENAVKVVKEQGVTDPDQLNEFGWKFYLFVNDQEKLQMAVEWMEKVLKEYPDATYMDTYASLLYKTGNQKRAVRFAEKALQAAEYELQDLMHYEVQLEKFKSGN